MHVVGKRVRGRPKKRWGDVIASDMRKVGVSEEDAGDIVNWKCRTRVADPK